MPANEVEIRIGTTPSHMVRVVDKFTGEKKFLKVREKPKYGPIGTSGVFPRDGGKPF